MGSLVTPTLHRYMRSSNYQIRKAEWMLESELAERASTNTYVEQELTEAGWTHTRAGRWIDPETGRSYNPIEASSILLDREDANK